MRVNLEPEPEEHPARTIWPLCSGPWDVFLKEGDEQETPLRVDLRDVREVARFEAFVAAPSPEDGGDRSDGEAGGALLTTGGDVSEVWPVAHGGLVGYGGDTTVEKPGER